MRVYQQKHTAHHTATSLLYLALILKIADCSLSTHQKEGGESKPSIALALRGGISESFVGQSLNGQQIFGRGFRPAVYTNRLTITTTSPPPLFKDCLRVAGVVFSVNPNWWVHEHKRRKVPHLLPKQMRINGQAPQKCHCTAIQEACVVALRLKDQ